MICMNAKEFKASLEFRLGGLDEVSFRYRKVDGKVLMVLGCIGGVCGEGRIPFGSSLTSQLAEKVVLEVLSELKKKMGDRCIAIEKPSRGPGPKDVFYGKDSGEPSDPAGDYMGV